MTESRVLENPPDDTRVVEILNTAGLASESDGQLPLTPARPRWTCAIRATLGVKAQPVTHCLLDRGLSQTLFALATLQYASQYRESSLTFFQ